MLKRIKENIYCRVSMQQDLPQITSYLNVILRRKNIKRWVKAEILYAVSMFNHSHSMCVHGRLTTL